MSAAIASFWVAGEPAPKGSMRAFRHRSSGRVIVTHDNARTRPWSQTVSWSARAAMQSREPTAAPVRVALEFALPRPKSHLRVDGSPRASAPRWPTAKRDVDKLVRAVLDALTGIVWVDDGQVVAVQALKAFAAPDTGCHVSVVEMGA